MGNEGGSFAHRSEMVKMKKKVKKVDKHEASQMKSELCTLSKEKLKKPIVMCRLGNFYNKEEVLKRLIEKSMPKTGFDHLKKMKDFKEIKFEEGPQGERLCPLTKTQVNGINKFVGFW